MPRETNTIPDSQTATAQQCVKAVTAGEPKIKQLKNDITMKVDIKTKKEEAIRRMKDLGIAGCIIRDFKDNDNVQICETNLGIGYWPSDAIKEVIAKFQEKFNALVYGGMKTTYRSGDVHYALLYVSDHQEEWESDRTDLRTGCASAYVHNDTDPWCSEIGFINFKVSGFSGGLVRTA